MVSRAISIHALLAESDCGCIRYNSQHPISIHALLAESDLRPRSRRPGRGISIHALLAESDAAARIWLARRRYFYPRSPCGERHCLLMVRLAAWAFLSTLSLRRATFRMRMFWAKYGISIHALLAESDAPGRPQRKLHHKFLSTLSLRRATRGSAVPGVLETYFYPRSPCGERPG